MPSKHFCVLIVAWLCVGSALLTTAMRTSPFGEHSHAVQEAATAEPRLPIDALPDSIVAQLMPHYHAETRHAFYRSDRRHRRIAREYYEQKFLELVHSYPETSESKWYHATLSALRSGPPSIEQFRWILQGSLRFTDMQLDRILVRCTELGWREGQELLLATNRISPMAQQIAQNPDMYTKALDSATSHSRPIFRAFRDRDIKLPLDWIPESFFLDAPVDYRESSMLMAVTRKNRADLVATLLEEGADPNIPPPRNGKTPLMIAAELGSTKMLRPLLAYRANVELEAVDGTTALHFAVRSNSTESVRLLSHAGAKANVQNRKGFSPLMEAASAGNPESVRLLLEHGANVHVRNHLGMTALHYATENDSLEAIQHLLQAGSKTDVQNDVGFTPVMIAILYDKPELLPPLLALPGNLDRQTLTGVTALHYAAIGNFPQMAQLLVNAGAEMDVQDGTGSTPLMQAAFDGFDQVVGVLLAAAPPPRLDVTCKVRGRTALQHAILGNHLETARLLVLAGASVEPQGRTLVSPLELAVMEGHETIARMLLKDGRAPVNVPTQHGSSVLAIAVEQNNLPMVRLLLRFHADPTVLNREGATMLEISLHGFPVSPEIIRALLQAGGDVPNAQGRRALSAAILLDHVDIVQVFLDAGMEVTRPDLDGTTPMQHAKRTQNQEILRRLKEASVKVGVLERVRSWSSRSWFP